AGRLGDSGDEIRRKLQAREHLHAFRHLLEGSLTRRAAPSYGSSLIESEACHGQHETRIDSVVADADAPARARAGLRPASPQARRVPLPTKNVEYLPDDRTGLARIDPGRASCGTDLDTAAAARAVC